MHNHIATPSAPQLILYDPISPSDPILHVNTLTHTLFCVVKIRCPDLTIMSGVVIVSPADQSFMSRTSYVCNDGYALKGDGNRICQMNDTWNGTDPECGEWFLFQTSCIYATSIYSYNFY
jgi:hypothetical protein